MDREDLADMGWLAEWQDAQEDRSEEIAQEMRENGNQPCA